MRHFDIAVVGAGPAGLTAACEAARAGAKVVVVDENDRPGGQLVKQIHKFFGSREHKAGLRGFEIAALLGQEAQECGVEMRLGTAVWGLFPDRTLCLLSAKGIASGLSARAVILATGANEKAVAFPGWTLPGVMTAGAFQTFVNVHRVLPGGEGGGYRRGQRGADHGVPGPPGWSKGGSDS